MLQNGWICLKRDMPIVGNVGAGCAAGVFEDVILNPLQILAINNVHRPVDVEDFKLMKQPQTVTTV